MFTEDFATFPGHSQFDVEDRRVQGWDVVGTGGGENGWLWLGNDDMTTTGTARRADPAWQSFRLEADVANSSSEYGILIGGDTHSRFGLYLDGARQQASLSWSYTAPPGMDLGSRQESFAVPLEIMPGMRYRLGLEMAGGHVRAVVQYPQLHWSETGTEQVVHSSLASIGNSLALTFDDQPYTVTQNGVASRLSPLESWVSETRTWELPGERGVRMGVSMFWMRATLGSSSSMRTAASSPSGEDQEAGSGSSALGMGSGGREDSTSPAVSAWTTRGSSTWLMCSTDGYRSSHHSRAAGVIYSIHGISYTS